MSYYGNDSNRTDGGQFHNHANANIWEQANAGVNHNDSYNTAHYKTMNHRTSMGLDPYTGLAPMNPNTYTGGYTGGGSSWSTSSGGEIDESQIGQVLWGVIKFIFLWPLAIAIVLGVTAAALVFAGKSFESSTLAAKAAQGEFAGYQPTPLPVLFAAKDIATPIDPESFLAAMRAFKPNKKADPKMLRSRILMGQAYRCAMQAGCREAIAKLEPVVGANLLRTAGGYFADQVKAGNENAARDMCLTAVKVGTSYEDILTARNLCREAVLLNPKSRMALQLLQKLDQSWAVRRAQAYDYAAEAQWRTLRLFAQ